MRPAWRGAVLCAALALPAAACSSSENARSWRGVEGGCIVQLSFTQSQGQLTGQYAVTTPSGALEMMSIDGVYAGGDYDITFEDPGGAFERRETLFSDGTLSGAFPVEGELQYFELYPTSEQVLMAR